MYFMYGNKDFIPEGFEVYNFSSLIEGFRTLNLMPPHNLGAVSEYDFDCKYAEWIMGDNNNFINFMSIICDFYYGKNVYLIISEDEWSIFLIESLLKFIQQRYGINGVHIQDNEDIIFSNETNFDPYYGIGNFDIDKVRYLELYEYQRILNGGKVEEE